VKKISDREEITDIFSNEFFGTLGLKLSPCSTPWHVTCELKVYVKDVSEIFKNAHRNVKKKIMRVAQNICVIDIFVSGINSYARNTNIYA